MLSLTMRGLAPPSISAQQHHASVVPDVLFGPLKMAAAMAVPGRATWLPGRILAQSGSGSTERPCDYREKWSIAAATPLAVSGTPANFSPISTPASVATSVRSLQSPR